MGDRGSIQVHDHESETPGLFDVTLFRHWGGSPEAMVDLVVKTYERTQPTRGGGSPYDRGRADCLLAALTTIAVEEERYNAYLGRNPSDGDNSDNGHYILHTKGSQWWLETENETTLWES